MTKSVFKEQQLSFTFNFKYKLFLRQIKTWNFSHARKLIIKLIQSEQAFVHVIYGQVEYFVQVNIARMVLAAAVRMLNERRVEALLIF